jgi:cytidylate kinase
MALEQEGTQVSDRVYLKTTTLIIEELAAGGKIVLLGRGSQMILKDLPGAVHVLCTAPQKFRAHRLAERDGIGIEEATRHVADKDRAQAAYYRKFWKVEFEDPRLYDLTVDTSRLSYEIAADLVASAARAKSSVAATA